MKKFIKTITLLLCMLFLLTNPKVFANNIANSLSPVEYSEEFKKWLELSEEEKKKVMMPKMYDFENSKTEYKNPLYFARMLGSSLTSKYSLKDVIPANLAIRNQQQTGSCWAFASLSSLETNLALSNYRNGTNTSKVYDFSERHMEYATSRIFANNVVNPIGYNRAIGGGNWAIAESYLINGTGAIPESEMPFENNENVIDISTIQNKTVSSQLYDTVYFEDYKKANDAKKVEIMNQIKQHIKNYGSIFAHIHGSGTDSSLFPCCNITTGAIYCNSSLLHVPDHAVSIIGWDDNYSIDNFAKDAKPTSNGAWIVRNSWGERQEYNLLELKQEIYNRYPNECNSKGWTEASLIPNEFIEQTGLTVENDIAYKLIGDNGIFYISYEDANISKNLYGILKASDSVNYNNIYQYDEYSPAYVLSYTSPKVMLGNIFEKGNSTEYLTQVSLHVPEKTTCRVYVNPAGSSFAKADMQLVSLKAGESETIDPGYHTLEFSKPIALTGNKFAIIVEITSSNSRAYINLETKIKDVATFDVVTVENGKCFIAEGHDLDKCSWQDLGKLAQLNSSLANGDSSIKAFTTTELIDESLKNITITTPPKKTSYFEGENFDKTGMVVTANYNSKKNPSTVLDSSSYSISNGTNLKSGQTSVTITYKDKSVNQTISVEKNSIVELNIKTPPTKTEYKEGQNFDKAGMVIEATRKNGKKEIITNYTIENGNNLKANQTSLTISYEGVTVKQKITVLPNPLIKIIVNKSPDKTNYIVGQNFDKTGMVILGVYQDKSTVEILDYTIENGKSLTKGQTSITISYLGKTTTQNITVVEKAITGISINKKPSKLKYIQNKENLDLSGGSITVTYNDETTEKIDMTSEQVAVTGFNNKKTGKITITLTYQSKTTNLEVEIVEEKVEIPEEEKAKNSVLTNAKGSVKEVKAYYFTDDSKKDYTLMKIEVNNIERILSNDKVEYYYYLSTTKSEENISGWIKIAEKQTFNDKLIITINSKDILNYEEVSKENVLYLYIKEVAVKGGDQSIAFSNALSLESNVEVETYVNNVKKENMNSGNISKPLDSNNKETNINYPNNTTTTAPGKLPHAGNTFTILTICLLVLFIAFFLLGRYIFLSKYVK